MHSTYTVPSPACSDIGPIHPVPPSPPQVLPAHQHTQLQHCPRTLKKKRPPPTQKAAGEQSLTTPGFALLLEPIGPTLCMPPRFFCQLSPLGTLTIPYKPACNVGTPRKGLGSERASKHRALLMAWDAAPRTLGIGALPGRRAFRLSPIVHHLAYSSILPFSPSLRPALGFVRYYSLYYSACSTRAIIQRMAAA